MTINKIGASPQTLATQQTTAVGAVGALGDREVRRSRSVFAAVKSTLSKAARYLSGKFKSLFSRRAQVGKAPTALASAALHTAAAKPQRAPLNLQKQGEWPVDEKNFASLFQYETDQQSETYKKHGICEQMWKDSSRDTFVVNGENMQRDPDRTIEALHELVKDKDGKVNEKLLLAVSQLSHQGALAEGVRPFTLGMYHDHGLTVVAGRGVGEVGTDEHSQSESRYEIQRLNSGDIQINISRRTTLGTAFAQDDPKLLIALKGDSSFESSFTLTINAESVARGQPTLTATPIQYAYKIIEAEAEDEGQEVPNSTQ